jgi:hypothetical protein
LKASYRNTGFLDGKLHYNEGIIFLGIAVVAVVALLWMLRRTEVRLPLNTSAPFLE